MKKISSRSQHRPLTLRQKYSAAIAELTQARKIIVARDKIIEARDKTIEMHAAHINMLEKQRFRLHAMYIIERDEKITAQKQRDKYKRLATVDSLTGLANRRGAKKALRHLVSSLNRTNKIGDRGEHYIAVVFMDLDNFGQVNKKFGDKAGDTVLRTIGQSLASHERGDDVMVRKGGEEFVMFAGCRDLNSAKAFAERVRNLVDIKLPISSKGDVVHVTASMGVTTIHPSEVEGLGALFNTKGDIPINAAINLAELGMRRAKAEGKNRVVAISNTPARATAALLAAPQPADIHHR